MANHADEALVGVDMLDAVTDAMVALHERYHGRRPGSAHTQMMGRTCWPARSVRCTPSVTSARTWSSSSFSSNLRRGPDPGWYLVVREVMAVEPPRPSLTLVGTAEGGMPLGSAPLASDWLHEPADEHWVGDLAAAITGQIVRMVREHRGGAHASAKATLSSGLVVVTIAATRDLLLRGMRAEASAIVEELTGRQVIAYLTDHQHEPDLAVMVFVLAVGPGRGA